MPLDPLPAWVLPHRRAIGERIRAARITAGLSQVQLGHLIGRDHKTIHRYEVASSAPSLIDMLLIADAVGVPLRDLV
ncbi:helix-turn-helix transcriptional regulator [Streptomyces uncialis]|uniref:helix-turn-helix transcriptional regulator n=1 Tax=Streptomyces uncialis TaxID=1048205 RepID=UPI003666CD20